MSELLIELFCEEIPAMMQRKAKESYFDIFVRYFKNKEIGFKEIEVFITPRRISIHVKDVDKYAKDKITSLKGPRVDAPKSAIDGFCKSNNVQLKELIIKKIKDQDCYFSEKETKGLSAAEIFVMSLHEPLMEYVWPKSMHWGEYKIKWIRPIQNILCLLDETIIPFKFGHLTANDKTFGHRFLAKNGDQAIQVKNFEQYRKALLENFVILNRSERVDIIEKELSTKANELKLTLKDDPILLEEVAGLAEFPVIMLGKIDQKFLKLPSEILVSSMRLHQKYFSLFDKEGNFAPYFLFVSNINPADQTNVISGNEKVLSARLSDALYFYQQDSKLSLEDRVRNLDNVVFHAKLGTLKAKTERIEKLVKFIDSKALNAYKAASICKSDILTEAVNEFPNLQGIMGYYYALNDGKSPDVALAIRNHYKPQGPSDSTPSGEAAILALADKVDSLCGLMIAGEKPNGSKDPYALRRLTLGIIRIILDNNLKQNLQQLIDFSSQLYARGLESDINLGYQEIMPFIEERAKNYFKDNGFDQSYVNAAVNLIIEPDLVITNEKLKALSVFFESNNGNDLLSSYKRASNILADKTLAGSIEEKYFNVSYEHNLFEALNTNSKKIEKAVHDKDFLESLKILASMKQIITDFFDNIMVMDNNPTIANNRLLLLVQTKSIFDKIVDFKFL